MSEARAERFYPHPPERVWPVVSRLDRWMSVHGFQPTVGCVFTVRDAGATCKLTVVDPPRTLTFSWRTPDVDSEVHIALVPEPGGTRVVVRHGGLPETHRGPLLSAWTAGLDRLRPGGVPFGLVAVAAVVIVVALLGLAFTAAIALSRPTPAPVPVADTRRLPVVADPPSPIEETPAPPLGMNADSCGSIAGGPIGSDGCLTSVLRCGDVAFGNTRGGVRRYDSRFYERSFCTPRTTDHDGGDERVYRLDVPRGTRARVWLDTPCADLDLAAIRHLGEECPSPVEDVAQCEENIRSGNDRERVDLWNDEPTTWWIVVEGKDEQEGDFSLTVQCEPWTAKRR